MSGGGGKGGSTTTEVKIPEWLQSAAQGNIRRAEDVAALGNIPYYGPDVAAMTPMQMAAGQGINTAAGAFGLGTNDLSMGIPAPQTFAGGVQGYSSGNLYDQALRELQLRAPGQYNAITGMFINPQTGAAPLSFGQGVPAMAQGAPAAPLSYGDGGGGGGGASGTPTTGGFTSIRDMYDGGGPGQSGATFSGGLLSGLSNAVGISPAKPAAAPTPKPAPAPAPKPAPEPTPVPTKASVAKFTSSNATSAKSSSSSKSTGGSNATRR